jgi:hypothetical protein
MLRERKSCSGTSGFAAVAWRRRKIANSATESATPTNIDGAVNPATGICTTAYTPSMSDAVIAIAPMTSAPSRHPIPGGAWTTRCAMRMVAIPSGTLTRSVGLETP